MSSMDWSAIVEAASLVFALVGAVISLWVRTTVDQRVANAIASLKRSDIVPLAQAHDSLKATVIQHDRTLIRVEAERDNLPTRKDTEDLRLKLEALVGTIAAMKVDMEYLGKSSHANGQKLDRLEQHIYEREIGGTA
jgi:hypothetical protein